MYDLMQNDVGEWISDNAQLEDMVTNYYKSLFHDEDQFWPLESGAFPVLNDRDMRSLDKGVSRHEIFNTVKFMGSFKAHGPDGFQEIFFQNQWQVIGNDFWLFAIWLVKFFMILLM